MEASGSIWKHLEATGSNWKRTIIIIFIIIIVMIVIAIILIIIKIILITKDFHRNRQPLLDEIPQISNEPKETLGIS